LIDLSNFLNEAFESPLYVTAMEPEPSHAAISAIAALQKRVRDLEDQALILESERESLRLRLNERDAQFDRRKAALNDAAAKAKEILNNTSTAMSQLREARAERQALKGEVENFEKALKEIQGKVRTSKLKSRRFKSGLAELLKKLAEYESLIGDVVGQLPCRPCLTQEEQALLASREVDATIMPPQLEPILANLQSLPKQFAALSLATKRKAVQALSEASAAVTELNAKIRTLEREKFASSTPRKFDSEIRRVSTHMFLLSNEIRKFEFE
jgi:chromosome segregation ATPase